MTQTILMVLQIIFHFHDSLSVELEKKMTRPYKIYIKNKKKQERGEKIDFYMYIE